MTRPITLIGRPGPDRLDRAAERLLGPLDQQPVLLGDLADQERRVGVAVDAADVRRDVDVDDVAVAQLGGVGDAVADHLVDRRAQRLGEALVAQRRGVGVVVEQELVADPVELVRGDAGGDVPADLGQRLRGDPAGDPHPLDRVGVLDLGSGVALRAGGGRRTRGARWSAGTVRSGEIRPGVRGGHVQKSRLRARCEHERRRQAVVLLPQAQDGGAGHVLRRHRADGALRHRARRPRRAIAHAAERTEAWDNDPRWKDD